MKKIHLENLPQYRTNRISWTNSVGYEVCFTYNDIEGVMKIIGYDKTKGILTIEYENASFNINTVNFLKCEIGYILSIKSKDFRIEIGTEFNDSKRHFTIINRERREMHNINRRWYKYHCNKCGYEGWIVERRVIIGDGCSCCSPTPRVVVYGINSIHDTAPWMIDLGVDFEEAKKFTCNSNQKIKCVCPHCNSTMYKACNNIYRYKSIKCTCINDGFSYPEKFIYGLLKQLGIEFETQYSPNYLKKKWESKEK